MEVIEGTAEEISRYMSKHPGERFKLINLTQEEATRQTLPQEGIEPNRVLLKGLEEIERMQIEEGDWETSGEDTDRILREGRAGGMYGDNPLPEK